MSCHQNLSFADTPRTCAACHQDPHRGELGADCATCHTERTFLDRGRLLLRHQASHLVMNPGKHRQLARGSELLNIGDLILTEVLQGFGSQRDSDQARTLLTGLSSATS